MAVHTHSTNLSRRLFLASAPIAALAVAGSHVIPSLADEFEAAWAAEKAVLDRFDHSNNWSEDAYDAAASRTSAVVQRILSQPATTLEDFKLRGRAYCWCYSGDRNEALGVLSGRNRSTDEKLVHAIMRDLISA